MKIDIRTGLRKALMSIFISAGILSVANVESIWEESRHAARDFKTTRLDSFSEQVKEHSVKVRAPAAVQIETSAGDRLRASLEQDELKDQSPFGSPALKTALDGLFKKGVAHFEREALRSSAYREEQGYDIVSYEIELKDGSKTALLAYLEPASKVKNGELDSERLPFVVLITPKDSGSNYAFFRSGELVEQSHLTPEEAQTLVSRHLHGSVPFLSVSR